MLGWSHRKRKDIQMDIYTKLDEQVSEWRFEAIEMLHNHMQGIGPSRNRAKAWELCGMIAVAEDRNHADVFIDIAAIVRGMAS